jgi:hypothetical protein
MERHVTGGQVLHMGGGGGIRNESNILSEKCNKSLLQELGVDGGITLRLILESSRLMRNIIRK